MLARLRVRTKLMAILLPLLLGLGVLATFGVLDRLDQRGDAQRSVVLIEVAKTGAELVDRLQAERLLSVALQNGHAPAAPLVDEATRATDAVTSRFAARVADLRDLDARVGNQTAAQVAEQLRQRIRAIEGARDVYDPVDGSPAAVSDAYSSIVAGIDAAGTQVMAAADDLAGGGASLHWLSAVKEADARTAADVTTIIAATAGNRLPDAAWAVSEVVGLRSDAEAATTVFTTDTDEAGRTAFDGVLRDPEFVASQAPYNALSTLDPAVGLTTPVDEWIDVTTGRLAALRDAEQQLFDRSLKAATTRSSDLEREVRLYLGGTATALLLALLLAASVTRSITSSLGRLTAAARTISTEQLPKLVESLRHPEVEQELVVTDIDLHSQDEFADLAAAFNAVEQTALDVASEQVATLRKGISDIFVNLARRNQSLLDRQIEFIDRLEANEEDPDQLENLFKLDHLATRMRRNAESLLVLAGAEAPRRRSKEVSLTDVIRVAVGEVEDFARITLLAVDEADAVGSAAVDVAHLLSELMENGTQYSPPERRVEVVGHRTNDGGYVISVSDQGVGMTPEAMLDANRQLARPPVVGLSLSRSLGFIVVATLAHRHGINVRLTESPSGGVCALVALPPSLLVQAPSAAPIAAPAEEALVAALPEVDLFEPGADLPPPPPFDLDAELTWAPDPPAFEDGPTVWTPTPVAEAAPVEPAEASPDFAAWATPEEPPFPPPLPPRRDVQPVEDLPAVGGPGILDPVFGLSPGPLPPAPPPSPFGFGEGEEPAPVAPPPMPEPVGIDSNQMNAAFEQGLLSLLDHPDGQRPGPSATQPAPPVPPAPSAPPAGPFAAPSPVAAAASPLLDPPVAPVAPPFAASPAAPPAAPPAPPAEPTGLPQRVRREPAPTAEVEQTEMIGSPSRPPEEIRSILSRYRSGLQTGRNGDDVADLDADPFPRPASTEQP